MEDPLVALPPVAVAVEIYPGAQATPGVGVYVDITRGTDIERRGESHTILVVVARTGAEDRIAGVAVVAISTNRGLTVCLPVNTTTQVDVVLTKQMARSVIRQSRRIIIWRIAKIYRVLDPYFVILNLTVSGLAGGLIYDSRRAAEAGVSRAGYGRGRDCEGQVIAPG